MFGVEKTCFDFSERKCMLCQLRCEHNKLLSFILNDITTHYERNNNGLIRVHVIKPNIKKPKEWVEQKLCEVMKIREMIDEIKETSDETLNILIEV